ncbi:Ig-like domain-containing protein [Saxibacter everestensis]|uniref:Ig-like domain-containing protein n=1 Tax=Saxibacter everestensis TaxID=2909229 RepID=A0ABY8QQR2_9MICO|nr:Ig-like domain-containing protein [Brevibacteriaceae bacterium ZFBP1038]
MTKATRQTVSAMLLVVAVLLGTGCDSGQEPSGAALQSETTTSVAPEKIRVLDGSSDGALAYGEPLTLDVESGRLKSVAVTDGDGDKVPGRLSDDGKAWTSDNKLPPAADWTWTAYGPAGGEASGKVETPRAEKTRRATVNLSDDATYGVAVPITVSFAGEVAEKARPDVEKLLKVTVKDEDADDSEFKEIEGSWAWLPEQSGKSQLHFRPKDYWPSFHDVHVDLPLSQADQGGGVYGVKDITLDFQIGREQIVKADAKSHKIVVIRDGETVATLPASYGSDSETDRNTRSGTHVVTEKWEKKRMTSERYNYSLMERWAVRINNNGEFIHANPNTTGSQGSANVSHGCINLSTANAKKYFKMAMYGDPVEVSGTKVRLADERTDIYDWALSWKKWKKLSALTDD